MDKMDSEHSGEKVLNKLEEFHKHQKELEWQRRRKRNTEVDHLISQLADPKMAEKLRVYRLVEEQFDYIETEIEKQVKAEIEAKKKALKKPTQTKDLKKSEIKSPGKLLQKAKQLRQELAQELETDEPPEPIRDNLKRIQEDRKLRSKEKLLSRSVRGPVEKVVYQPTKIDRIPFNPVLNKKKPPKKVQSNPITMLSKPIVRDLTEQERKDLMPRNNVGYVAFEHNNEDEPDNKPGHVLSAHSLGGINISPMPCMILQQPKTNANVKIINEIYEKIDEKEEISIVEAKSFEPVHDLDLTPSEVEDQVSDEKLDKGKLVEEIKTLVQNDGVLEITLGQNEEQINEEEEDNYSDDFEDNNHEELLKEFIPKVMAMGDFTENDSVTGRLSTITEVTSQATSVENSKKEQALEEGPLSSSSKSSSIITSPIHRPPKTEDTPDHIDTHEEDSLAKLSLSEGPIIPSEDSSNIPSLAKDPYSMISNAGDQVIQPKPTSRADHIDMTTTVPDLDLTPSEQISIPKHHATSSSSSAVASSSTSISLQMSSFTNTESEFSEGQVLVLRQLTSEGEINISEEDTKEIHQRKMFSSNSDLSLSFKDSLEDGKLSTEEGEA